MSIKEHLKQVIYGNKKLYMLSRVMKELSTDELYGLLWGHYEYSPDFSSEIIECGGELNPQEIVSYISNGEKSTERSGFFAVMRATLLYLYYADSTGYVPVVKWGKFCLYYDPGMDGVTKNVFEYYYEKTSHISPEDALKSKHLIRARGYQWKKLMSDIGVDEISYHITDRELECLAMTYKKYCRLNQTTKEYIEGALKTVINGQRTLGVHVRGTDFRYQVINHPIIITPEEFLQETKKLLAAGEYERVFLATDDEEALTLFQREIPTEQLVYYSDTQRSTGYTAPFDIQNPRPLHHYKLGLEVLRDVYTLACCDGLIGGLSQVGFAARYINIAVRTPYKDCIIIDNGVRKSNSPAAWKRKIRLSKEAEQLRLQDENEHGENTKE